ncbi:hypothetical protein ACFO3J_30730, partial [Streptomyces polygonati]
SSASGSDALETDMMILQGRWWAPVGPPGRWLPIGRTVAGGARRMLAAQGEDVPGSAGENPCLFGEAVLEQWS